MLNLLLRGKIIPLMFSFTIGKAWARYLPNISLFGVPLNPGPFTIKEHVIITIMAGVSGVSAYAVSVAPIGESSQCSAVLVKFPHNYFLDRRNSYSEKIL